MNNIKELIPDLISPLEGYRIFKVDNKKNILSYYVKNHIWNKGINTAICYPKYINYTEQKAYEPQKYSYGNCHKYNNCPNHNCCCGLYACFSLTEDYKSYNLINRIHYTSYDYYISQNEYQENEYYTIGKIIGWGRCEVYDTGFRSQYAKIISLAYNSSFNKLIDIQKEVANNYQVPLLKIDEI